jgi:hypothetical protein
MYHELDAAERAQLEIATATQEGMSHRVLEILDEISKENREGGAHSKP